MLFLSDSDVQQDKDKFGNDVTFLARPLPVEYLIIDVSETSHKPLSFPLMQ